MGRCRQGILRRPRGQVRQRGARRAGEGRALSGEAAFVAALRRIATHPAARGLVDDAAVVELGAEALVLTHDTMVEGVHWLAGQDLADVAWKLVAVNLSDLAAKGAEPIGVLLSYMLGDEHDDRQFTAGLDDALRAFDVPLLGGDTVSGGNPRTFGLTAVGRACHRPVPSRAGARPGDTVWITGPVGAALMGFEALHAGRHGDSRAYRRPTPLLREGAALAPYVSAMMDVSDGLLLDASRMAGASGVTIDIAVHSVPIAAPEERRGDALRWGDDYQLLFTAPADYMPLVAAQAIGTVLPRGASALLLDGSPPAPGDRLGYEHAANGGVR